MVKKNCFKISTGSAKETKKIGEGLATWLIKYKKSAILVLSGDLGAGKTVLVKGLAKGLGVRRTILSPSFVLLRTYQSSNGWQLNHIDAYRLTPADAKIFDFKKFTKPQTITVVEWPEKISNFLPRSSLKIKIDHQTPETRVLELPTITQKHVTRFINRRQ